MNIIKTQNIKKASDIGDIDVDRSDNRINIINGYYTQWCVFDGNTLYSYYKELSEISTDILKNYLEERKKNVLLVYNPNISYSKKDPCAMMKYVVVGAITTKRDNIIRFVVLEEGEYHYIGLDLSMNDNNIVMDCGSMLPNSLEKFIEAKEGDTYIGSQRTKWKKWYKTDYISLLSKIYQIDKLVTFDKIKDKKNIILL